MQRSSREATNIPKALAEWLATELPDGAEPTVTLHTGIEANGMSSETLVLDASWTEHGEQREGEFVARVAPAAEDVPVFPSYRLQDQFDAMRLAARYSDVPVPTVRWMEPTGDVLGTPFFLMDRVEGAVPPDVLPYNFGDNWLFDAGAEQQRRLQDNTVAVIAGLHGIVDAASTFKFLEADAAGDTPAAAQPRADPGLVRLRAHRRRAVPADRARSRLARGPRAYRHRHGALLG